MPITADTLLGVAESQLGYAEDPPGSNRTKYGRWYADRTAAEVFATGQWCAMFVSWCADQAGALDIIPAHAYTPSGVNWFRTRGRYHTTGTPERGDIVYFYSTGLGRVSHVGIVTDRRADGLISTIEGNTDDAGGRTGGKVMRKLRAPLGQKSSFYPIGYGRPDWTALADRDAPVVLTPVEPAPVVLGLEVDGRWGPATARRLQEVLGTEADGVISNQVRGHWNENAPSFEFSSTRRGSDAIRAVQRRLTGLYAGTIDGLCGPGTITALQRYLGTTQDGRISPESEMVKAMQRRLNSGTF